MARHSILLGAVVGLGLNESAPHDYARRRACAHLRVFGFGLPLVRCNAWKSAQQLCKRVCRMESHEAAAWQLPGCLYPIRAGRPAAAGWTPDACMRMLKGLQCCRLPSQRTGLRP